MASDAFDQLRIADVEVAPRPAFAAALLARLERALGATRTTAAVNVTTTANTPNTAIANTSTAHAKQGASMAEATTQTIPAAANGMRTVTAYLTVGLAF